MNTIYANTGMVFVRISDGKLKGPSLQLGLIEGTSDPDYIENYKEVEMTDEIKEMLGDEF